jgi:hypothetical protein
MTLRQLHSVNAQQHCASDRITSVIHIDDSIGADRRRKVDQSPAHRCKRTVIDLK